MRKTILYLVIALFLNTLSLFAQTKETKPQEPPGKINDNGALAISELMSKTSDDLAQYLVEEYKKQKIKLRDLNDEIGFAYDEKGRKTKEIAEYFKWMYFTNGYGVDISADKNDNCNSVNFSFPVDSTSEVLYRSFKKKLGFDSWQTVSVSDDDTTYRKGNLYVSAYLVETEDYAERHIYAYKAPSYNYKPATETKFDVSTLSVRNNEADLGYSLIQYFKNLGLEFLYKGDKKPVITTKDELINTLQTRYYFSEGAYFTIISHIAGYINNILLCVPNPLTFSRLKKNIGIVTWEKAPETDGGASNYVAASEVNNNEGITARYRLKNIISELYQEQKTISLFIRPEITDIKVRYDLAPALDFTGLYTVWSFKKSATELEDILTPRFLNKVVIDWNKREVKTDYSVYDNYCQFSYKSSNDSLVMCRFYKNQSKDNTTVMSVFSRDDNYVYSLANEFKNSGLTGYYTQQVINSTNDNTIKVFILTDAGLAQEKAMEIRQKENEELAKRNQELQQAERERYLKQQRDAQNIQKYGNILLNYLKTKNQ